MILTPQPDERTTSSPQHVANIFEGVHNRRLTASNTIERAKNNFATPSDSSRNHSLNSTTAGAHSAPLVTTETTSHNVSEAPTDWERRPLELQRVMWGITDDKTLAGCHRWRAGGAQQVGIVWRGNKAGRFMGLQNSHSVWGSPLAALQITRARRDELMQAMTTWNDAGQHHSVLFLTLTLRHAVALGLSVTWDALGKCWSAATSGSGGWTGTKTYAGDKRRFGIAHWVKSVEVTHGDNGWHPHLHVALFLERELGANEVVTLKKRLFKRWATKAVKLGLKAPSAARGIDLQQSKRGADLEELAGYLTKGMVSGLGAELTGGALKDARNGNRTPFQVLETMAADKASTGRYSPRDVAIWREWEVTSKGRRFMAWSRGAKDALGVLDLDDAAAAELVEREDDGDAAALVATLTEESWQMINRDIDARLDIQRAVKADRLSIARKQLIAVLEAKGLAYRLVTAPIHHESVDIWQQLDSAYGRAEVRAEAAAMNSEMMQDYCTERAAGIAEMYQAYLQ